jgi:CheY-like chemotaxis protein
MSAMGGGPGAELLGFSDFVCRKNFSNTPIIIDFLLVDRVAEWDETWHILKSSVDRSLLEQYGKDRQQWPVFTSRSFLPMSLTDPDQFSHFSVRFRDVRIYILSYVVSELLHLVTNLADVIDYLSSISQQGAKILFIDRSQPEVMAATKEIIEEIDGLRTCDLIKRREEWDVNFEDLGDWYLQIPRLPRSSWQSFFHLAEVTHENFGV